MPGRNTSLLEVSLYTGRRHQIRAQLAALGHPVLGDIKYGAASATQPDDRKNEHSSGRGREGGVSGEGAATMAMAELALHAAALSFAHPIKVKGELKVVCPLPAQWKQLAGPLHKPAQRAIKLMRYANCL